mmetsp:Transcript_17351/g.21880  ORF Transcript_17351/g.21880 Transcript_17351/m.21880 type:complete len:118 (-) Transcript_17351:180-533(-)|eukprot:CAMPEP_0170469234 /NCGR_PEP_ID=MMETSP0123-20130129/12135_1 /TAXON_ID=182087 /ORGANISM="Favella ehrenbergii, Strain Fehren 1" /LENGTH=117 /DNA_ID=CAMNT_0010736041 /DNA_START=313 /DNA_END=666 /DNA_ORIENTATION=-
MVAARAAHSGVSFTSARQTGLFMDVKNVDDSSLYTRISTAIEEEDWAVMNATLATFFATWFFALLIGVCCGVYCCAKLCASKAGGYGSSQTTEMATRSPGSSNHKGNDVPDTERGLQ